MHGFRCLNLAANFLNRNKKSSPNFIRLIKSFMLSIVSANG